MKYMNKLATWALAAATCVAASSGLSGCDDEGAATRSETSNAMGVDDAGAGTAESAPALRKLEATGFEIADVGDPDCPAGAPGDGRTSPAAAELSSELGTSSAEFVVSLRATIDDDAFPVPAERIDEPGFDPAADPMFRARADEVARQQACAVQEVNAIGGRYLRSFLLVNAFTAELDAEQAVALASHPDVRLVERSETDLPPPG